MPDQLKELQRLFAEAVLVRGPYYGQEDLLENLQTSFTRKCWFQANIPGIDTCGGGRPGVLEAAHWIKRQQVERWVKLQYGPYGFPAADLREWEMTREELVAIAAWDPRNAVPACEAHHRRFDSQRMPPLRVPRALVPVHVTEFVNDLGLETALEDKHPLEA